MTYDEHLFQDVNFIKPKEGQKRYHKLNIKTV